MNPDTALATQDNSIPLDIVPPSALEAITRGEVDIQISTAHRYPRSIASFQRRALEMVTLDEETAASCIYSRPVGKEKDEKTGKWVEKYAEGLSVRTAEIVGACYGNLRVGAMVVEQTERYVKARGFAHDLESNFASTSEVIESTVTKDGKPFSERMRVVIAKSCVAKARRDATFQVVPKALCRTLEIEARKVAIGDSTTLEARRDKVMAWAGKLGIAMPRVFAALNVEGEQEIGLDELTILTGLRTAIRDGDIKIDDAFPLQDSTKAAARSEPIMPFPEDDPAASSVNPKPIAAVSPQQRIMQSLADLEIKEAAFMKAAGLSGKMLTQIPDEQAEELIKDFAEIVRGIK